MQLRPATLSDTSRVITLMRRLGLSPPSERRWTALWTSNPAYRAEVPIGWVVESDGAIVGFIGNLPRLMWDGTREIIARVPTTWAVDPAARAYSLPLLFQWLNQRDAPLLHNTTATPEAAALLDKLNVARVPCPTLPHRAVWIASHAAMLSGSLRRMGLGALSFLGQAAAPLDWLRRAGNRSSPPAGFEWRTAFGPEFDALWQRLAERPVLQSVRDAANLRWAYDDAISEGQLWILSRGGDVLSGYAVFRSYPIPTMGLARMRMVDFADLDDDPAPYVVAALARCRREGVHVLECTGLDARLNEALARLKPVHAKFEGWQGYWRAGDPALAARLAREESWYTSHFDGDSSLW